MAAEEERHEPDDRRHLERLNNAEILREGGEERHDPRHTGRVAVRQTVHDDHIGRQEAGRRCQRPTDVDKPPGQSAERKLIS